MSMYSAWSPGHISTIFYPVITDNSISSGSLGSGFSITNGCMTYVEFLHGKSTDIILINGKNIKAPVSRYIINKFRDIIGNIPPIKVSHKFDIPISSGFGASGAGALSLSLALNFAIGSPLTREQCGKIAHEADVINQTGLGDVISQYVGGIELRTKAGAPGYGEIKYIYPEKYTHAAFCFEGTLNTKSVLGSRDKIRNIKKIAMNLINNIIQNQSIENIISCSRVFADKAGFMSHNIKKTLHLLNNKGYSECSQIMLGNGAFCLCSRKETKDIIKLMSIAWPTSKKLISPISLRGAYTVIDV